MDGNDPWQAWQRERQRKHREDGDYRAAPVHGSKLFHSLGEAIHGWVRSGKLQSRIDRADVVTRWSELVGEAVAARASAVRLERGKLFVNVMDSAWRHQLLYMREELIGTINRAMGHKVVREIVFTHTK